MNDYKLTYKTEGEWLVWEVTGPGSSKINGRSKGDDAKARILKALARLNANGKGMYYPSRGKK